jgi:hypothetical protein
MNFFKPALILSFAFLAVFGEATLSAPRHYLGAQIDLLPALMVYAALNADLVTLVLLAVMGGLWFDSLSVNPPGVSIVPLFLVGFPIYIRRELLLRSSAFAQLTLGLAASAIVPALALLILLNGGHEPLIGWGTLWQWFVMTVGGGLATPVIFQLGDWCGNALGYKLRTQVSFRDDREIRHGRILK